MARAGSSPFSIKGIEHVLVLVNDLERALTFYEGVLGARVESRLPTYAMVELRAGGSHVDLVDTSSPEGAWAAPPVSGGRNVDHIGLRVSAASEGAVREHLSANDVAILEERVEEGTGRRMVSFYVRDPAGNTIELMMARNP